MKDCITEPPAEPPAEPGVYRVLPNKRTDTGNIHPRYSYFDHKRVWHTVTPTLSTAMAPHRGKSSWIRSPEDFWWEPLSDEEIAAFVSYRLESR